MDWQHLENLFRRYKDSRVTVKTLSGGVYEGRVSEVSDVYVSLLEGEGEERGQVFLLYHAVEAVLPQDA